MLAMLVRDRKFLRTCQHLVNIDDFKVEGNRQQYIIAKLATKHYAQYNEPIGDLLTIELKDYARQHHVEGEARERLLLLGKRVLRKHIVAGQSITDKVVRFRKDQIKDQSLKKLIALQNSGDLTDQSWLEISEEATIAIGEDPFAISDYFAESEARISRREFQEQNRFPLFFIEPLDYLTRGIARGHLGLVVAPYKRGKSLLLIHIALALCIQRYNVLYFTLEDPKADVEDRFDSNVAKLPIKKLADLPKTFRYKFKQFTRHIHTRMKIVDATEGGLTVAKINAIVQHQRNQGFAADAVIVDYDDELQASKRHNERRHEFAEIYRDMRQSASENDQIWWTAAQTKRGTMGEKILTGDDLAEDISKVRKVSMALSIGRGEYGEDSMYLNVAAHKFDAQGRGVSIVPDLKRMCIYDRAATMKAIKAAQEEKGEEVLSW
jgi:replicative DNA helicase